MVESEYVIEDPKSINQQAFEQLRSRITSGQFQPGERLVELQIAKAMGVSRAPVREALRRLQQEGLVVNKPRRGTFVMDVTPADATHLYIVRVALEGLAIELLIDSASEDALRELEGIIGEMVAAGTANDLARFADLELRFHETLCARSGNPILERLYHTLGAQVRMVVAFEDAHRRDLSGVARRHAPLLDAIRRRDVAAARSWLRAHILDSLPHVIANLEAQGHAPVFEDSARPPAELVASMGTE